MCYARDSSPGPHKQMLPNKLSILYENYSANFFLAESGYVAGKLESESRRAGGGMPPPNQDTVCSNGFYADITYHQMQQYKSCLKSFL